MTAISCEFLALLGRHWPTLTVACGLLAMAASQGGAAETTAAVKFSGGHETDRQDGGRPVALIAGALGVKPEVFRQAFSGVRPAKNGKPSGAEARRNKEVLMKALQPHGVTNDRLDEVSNYYRYRPQAGEMWPTADAKAHAVIENGKVKKIVIDDPGHGYSSPPTATIEGMESIALTVDLKSSDKFTSNGAIGSVKVKSAK